MRIWNQEWNNMLIQNTVGKYRESMINKSPKLLKYKEVGLYWVSAVQEADKQRREEFKKYEMEKKFEKEARLKQINDTAVSSFSTHRYSAYLRYYLI